MDINKDYYKILEISKNATDKEIKKSYRKLAVKYHPDKNKGSKDSEIKFKNISEAYQVLKDDKLKSKYDFQSPYGKNYKSQWDNRGFESRNPFSNNNPFGGGFSDFSDMRDIFDIFSESFKSGGYYDNYYNENLNIDLDVTVTLKDVYLNNSIPVEYYRYKKCDTCDGIGFNLNSEYDYCLACSGRGHDLYGFKCKSCNGTGKLYKEKCNSCYGQKVLYKKEKFEFKNSYRIDNTFKTRKSKYGHHSKKSKSRIGDLTVRINYVNNTEFKRTPKGLEYTLNLHYEDAIKGKKVQIKLPDDKNYNLTIPPKTKDGQIFTMKNKGTYTFDGKTRTDLLIKINIIIDYEKVNQD